MARERGPGATGDFIRDNRGVLVAQRTSAAQRFYPITDSIGSVVSLTDASGNEVNRYAYQPFGLLETRWTTTGVSSPFKFAGEYFDAAHSQYKIGARYYIPNLGRWTQRDPVGQPVSPTDANAYAYAAQDPINNTDPSGTLTIVPCFTPRDCFEIFKSDEAPPEQTAPGAPAIWTVTVAGCRGLVRLPLASLGRIACGAALYQAYKKTTGNELGK